MNYFSDNTKNCKDYSVFGSILPGRSFNSNEYRFGFNGMEKDDEITGVTGSHLDFGARIYDSRVARWLSIDPLAIKYPSLSPYCFVGNMPIIAIDPDGEDIYIVIGEPGTKKGEIQKTNAGMIISKMAASEKGNAMIQKYINNPDVDVYIKIGKVPSTAMGQTLRNYDNKGNFGNPGTFDIGGHSLVDQKGMSEFENLQIDKEKQNFFILLDENEYGKKDIGSEIKQKEGAKVLGHEMGAHLTDKKGSTGEQEHKDWGQKQYGTFNAEKGSKAEQYNKEVDKSTQSNNEYKINESSRGRHKLTEKEK